jgi:hypothetical protein
MKIGNYIAALLLLGVLGWSPITMAQSFETGLLKDEKGSTDTKTNTIVHNVSNMHGISDDGGPTVWKIRYVGIQIPKLGIDPKKVIVLDSLGKTIQHKDPEKFEEEIDQKGTKGTYLKLFLEHQAGFSFRLKYDN